MTHKLLLLAGDGIGPEAMAEVKKLIAVMNEMGASFETEEALVGGCAYDAHGVAIAEADVAKATLYKYFPVKEAIIAHCFREEIATGMAERAGSIYLDGGRSGLGEDDGAAYLLAYWMGRYYGYVTP